jgi:hypothetical protein
VSSMDVLLLVPCPRMGAAIGGHTSGASNSDCTWISGRSPAVRHRECTEAGPVRRVSASLMNKRESRTDLAHGSVVETARKCSVKIVEWVIEEIDWV